MAGSLHAEGYRNMIKSIPDHRFTLMNHGYFGEGDSFDWLREEDVGQKYEINIVHFVVKGVELTGKRVLDVGCGRGGNCSYLARYTDAKEIVGLDFCEGHIEFCRKVHQFENVSFKQGDAQYLPFDDEEFDIVINIESSHDYPDLAKFIKGVERVLVKGGIFCCADAIFSQALQEKNAISDDVFTFACGGHFARRKEPHETILRDAGFIIEKTVDITDSVIRSIESDHGNFHNFAREMLDPSIEGNAEMVNGIVESTVDHALKAYKNRDSIYMYWRLKKPA